MAPILGVWASQNYVRGLTVDYLVVAGGGGGGNSNGGGGGAGGLRSTVTATGGGGSLESAKSSLQYFTGSSVTYATGGSGFGGSNNPVNSADRNPNTGDGGWGNSDGNGGGAGGSGIVVVRYFA